MWSAILFLPACGMAGTVDSLLHQLQQRALDTHRIVILHALTDQLSDTNPDSAFLYCWQAFQLSQDLNWIRGKAESTYRLGLLYRDRGENDQAIEQLYTSADLFARIRDPAGQATSLRRIGYIYSSSGDYPKASDVYQQALRIAMQGNAREVIAKILSGMTGLYRLQGQYDLAVKYGLQAMELQEEMGDKQGLTYTLDRPGVVYKLQEDYEKALKYYQRALQIRQELPGIRLSDLAYSSMVIGETYMELDSLDAARRAHEQSNAWYQEASDPVGVAYSTYHLGEIARRKGERDEAWAKLIRARDIFVREGVLRGEVNTLYSLTALLVESGQFNKAEHYANEFYRSADQLGSRNHRMNARFFKYQIAKATSRWAEALSMHEEYMSVKDSLWNEDNGAEIARLEAGYTIRQKDQENVQLTLEAELAAVALSAQRQRMIVLMVILGLFVLMGLLLVRVIRKEKRHIQLLESKNQEIEAQRQALVIAEMEMKAINENLEELVSVRTEELKRSNEQLEQYAYLASHDLKQPLRTISGFAQLLEREWHKQGTENARMQEYIEFITGGIKYMNQLIDNILKSSRYAFSDGNKFQKIHLNDVVTQVKSNLQRQIMTSGAIIHEDIPDTPIIAVRVKIEQLIQNLLTNAIKFSRPGQSPEITIQFRELDEQVEIRISDNGIGIPKEYHESIFQMFRRLDREKQMAGVGLGLTICRKIAEQHGGQIRVESQEGKGSTFVVRLSKDPVASSEQAAA